MEKTMQISRRTYGGIVAVVLAACSLPSRATPDANSPSTPDSFVPAPELSFTWDHTPAPRVDSWLWGTAISGSGRVVAVGEAKQAYGAAHTFPLIIERSPTASWKVDDVPAIGDSWHQLQSVTFLPGADEDFVAVGTYQPDPMLAYTQGLI